ncbi:MAG TPA: hypothetical protein VJV75_12445, partial [Candidatus Polarisedimenticolia bacterium]|nr:hypothetical protein [Candidatus Polarisedimenticolia bacterium]
HVVNLPHRVRGAPVFADMQVVTALGAGQATPVGYDALVDYARADAVALDRSAGEPVRVGAEAVEIDLEAPASFRSGLVWPSLDGTDTGSGLRLHVGAGLTARVPLSEVPAERIWYWSEGHLHPVVTRAGAGAPR